MMIRGSGLLIWGHPVYLYSQLGKSWLFGTVLYHCSGVILPLHILERKKSTGVCRLPIAQIILPSKQRHLRRPTFVQYPVAWPGGWLTTWPPTAVTSRNVMARDTPIQLHHWGDGDSSPDGTVTGRHRISANRFDFHKQGFLSFQPDNRITLAFPSRRRMCLLSVNTMRMCHRRFLYVKILRGRGSSTNMTLICSVFIIFCKLSVYVTVLGAIVRYLSFADATKISFLAILGTTWMM